MLEIRLENISPDGEGYVAYLQIVDADTGKVLDNKCLPYTTEAEFNTVANKYLADFKVNYQPKEDIKNKVLKNLGTINLKEKTP
jgi:hypothetical protein